MTLRKDAPRAKSRWAVLGVVAATASLLLTTMVFANLAGSTFEGGDGNLVVNTTGNHDWANAPNRVVGVDVPSGTSDNSFGQGTNEDDPNVVTVTGSIPPNKNDLTRFYIASEHVGTSDFLYLAWERAVNIGNANLDFEINQATTANLGVAGKHTIVRTANDLLVTYDFGGSGTPSLHVLKWVTSATGTSADCFSAHNLPCWGKRITLGSADSEGAVNTGNVTDPVPPNNPRTLGAGLFGEAAINLTTSGVFPAGTCEALGSAFLKSRSSSSFTAEIKDFIAPQPVNISNCGTVIIHKTTLPAGGTGFPFTSNVSTNPADTSNASFSLNDGGTKTMLNVLSGSYNVTETVGSIGNYTLTGIDCSAGDVTPTSTSTATGATAFTIGAGQTLECTYTNTKNKNTPSADTAPSVIPQDTASVSGMDSSGVVEGALDQELHFDLWSNSTCDGTMLYSEAQAISADGDYSTSNPGGASGYTITAASETDYWHVYYDGDSTNNPFDDGCVEATAVTLTPFTAP
jgi:hypothetical protein